MLAEALRPERVFQVPGGKLQDRSDTDSHVQAANAATAGGAWEAACQRPRKELDGGPSGPRGGAGRRALNTEPLGDSTDPGRHSTGGCAGTRTTRRLRASCCPDVQVCGVFIHRRGAQAPTEWDTCPYGPHACSHRDHITPASAVSQTRDLTWSTDPLCPPFPGQITHTGGFTFFVITHVATSVSNFINLTLKASNRLFCPTRSSPSLHVSPVSRPRDTGSVLQPPSAPLQGHFWSHMCPVV